MQLAEGHTAAEPPLALLQGHSEKAFLHASAQLVNRYVRLPWCEDLIGGPVNAESRSLSGVSTDPVSCYSLLPMVRHIPGSNQ